MNDFILNALYFKIICVSVENMRNAKESNSKCLPDAGVGILGWWFSFFLMPLLSAHALRPAFFLPPETTSLLNSGNGFCSSDDHRKGRPLQSTHSPGQLLLTPVGHIINFDRCPAENTK